MAQNPTIIVGHLNDKELKDSIDKLVEHVDKGTKQMVNSFNSSIDAMKAKLAELGQQKVDFNVQKIGDIGSTQRTKSVKDENLSLKELSVSYDRLLGALQMAKRQERLFSSKDIWTLTREELDKYAATLKRVEELEKSMQSMRGKMAFATAQQSQFTPNLKEYTDGLIRSSDELKKMSAYYKELEKASARTTRIEQLKQEAAAKDNTVKSLRAEISLMREERELMQRGTPELREQNNLIAQKEAELKKELQTRTQIRQEIVKGYEQDFRNAKTLPATNMDEALEKLRRLQKVQAEMKDVGFLFKEEQLNRVQNAINSVTEKVEKLRGKQPIETEFIPNITKQVEETQRLVEMEQRYGKEVAQVAQYFREAAEGLFRIELATNNGGKFFIKNPVYYNDAKSIEEQLTAYKALNQEANLRLDVEKAISSEKQKHQQAVEEQIAKLQQQAQQQEVTMQKQHKLTFAEYDYEHLRDAIASVIGVKRQEIRIADIESDSLKALSNTLKQLRQAYDLLSGSERKSPMGQELVNNIQDVQFAIQKIQSQLSRPTSFDMAKALPEKTVEEINHKIQMLKSYATNLDTTAQGARNAFTAVYNEVERLNKKTKDLQRTSNEVAKEKNAQRLDVIGKMPEYSINKVIEKIRELRQYMSDMKTQPVVNESNLRNAQSLYDKLAKKVSQYNAAKRASRNVEGTEQNVNKALQMQERTLGEIAKKMQRLQSIRLNLNIDSQKDLIRQVSEAYDGLRRKQQEIVGSNKTLIESNNTLSRSLNYIKNRLAFYLTIGASTQFVKTIYDIRSQYELLERSIGILVDSLQQGTQIFTQLNAMALNSPFTTMELGAAAKQLVAYDIAAKDVVSTTKRIGDIAAAVGIPLERLTYALGQIKAYGYLNARDARMFSNAGIPLVKQLADRYTELEGRLVSVSDVYDRIKKKSISFEDVVGVIHNMTDEGGKFFDFQAKAADTMKVRLANLTLAYNNMLNEMGKEHQTLLTQPLVMLKNLFENWRKVDNAILSLVQTFGTLKAIQFLVLLTQGKLLQQVGWQMLLGKKLTNIFITLGKTIKTLFTSWTTWLSLVIAAGWYLYDQYKDIQNANEQFNKSISESTQENIDSINKMFKDYKQQLDSIGSASLVEQQKMWERIQDEIEKSTKNANGYLKILNDVDDVAERINAGDKILSQVQDIEKEVKRLSDLNMFKIGGGLFNDTLAKDLQQVNTAINEIVDKTEGFTKNADSGWGKKAWADYITGVEEAKKEVANFTSVLEKADISRIMGSDEDFSDAERFAHLREFASIVRDNFLATEEGQKIGIHGQMLLNAELDKWIAKQGVANNILSETNYGVEKNRTAWETFFSQLTRKQKETLDYLIETGQTTTDEFKDIWDNAAKLMKSNSHQAYLEIQDDIAKLRATPDIVIKVVYQQEKANLDDQQQAFEQRFLTPQGEGVKTAKKYLDERKKLNEKYGRFQRKQGEDNVEWEKRLGDTYRDNEGKIKKLKKQIESLGTVNDANMEQKRHELDLMEKENDALEEIRKYEGFDYSKESKNKSAQKKGEDELATALQKEIQLINEMRSNYDKLRKSGVSNMDAINLASQGYEDTILRINNILGKYGIDKFNASNFTGKDVRTLLNNLESQRKTLLASGKVKLASLQSLDVEIKKLSVDAKTYDMKKITDGLNNELGKLKEEYELAVELEANPELGDMFTDMLGIDVSELPRTFEQIFSRANKIAQKHLDELGVSMSDFDLLSTQIKGDETNRWMGLDIDSEPVKALLKMQKTYQDMFKKNLIDTEKDLDDYVKKYGSYADKVAEIESNRLQRIERLNNAYYTEEMRRRPEYLAKLAAIDEGANKEIGQVDFDEFKNSRYYTMMFENLDYVSTRAIRSMRDKLSELMTTMNNLTPEQLKTLMQQYEKLEQTLVKRNPFKTLTKDVKQYIKTTSDRRLANKSFRDAQNEYDAQKKIVSELKVKKENMIRNQAVSKQQIDEIDVEILKQEDVLRVLREQLEAAEKKADKYNLIKKLAIEESQQVVQMVNANVQSLGQLRDFIQDDLGVALGDELNGFIDGMGKASEGVNNILSSAQSGNVVGTVLGVGQAITGVLDGVASIFGDGAARTKRLNREIAQSEEIVRQLNMAYKDLERTVDSAMGAEELRARRSEISNKKAQLAELERQRTLEQQKRSKDRDDEKIKQYDESIQDLRNEIDDITSDITSTLLGSGIKDAAESFVDTWVSAWRQGEDTMDALGEKFDSMIDTMIAKSLASRLVSKRIQGIWDAVDAATDETSLGGAEITMDELQRLRALIGDKSIAERINDDLTNLYNALGIAYGVDSTSEKNLSNLQQGIQGITEDTAGALEAYMNGVSQQVYLQSDLLTQIRDTVGSFDIDIQTSTISQMLLQLQQSYAVQMAIQNILNGALNPSGRAFMVELNS